MPGNQLHKVCAACFQGFTDFVLRQSYALWFIWYCSVILAVGLPNATVDALVVNSAHIMPYLCTGLVPMYIFCIPIIGLYWCVLVQMKMQAMVWTPAAQRQVTQRC